MCTEAGRVYAATVVDHIKPLALGGSDDDVNTRNLCEAHHLKVTAEQFGTERKRGLGGYDARGMPIDPNHPWSRGAPGR